MVQVVGEVGLFLFIFNFFFHSASHFICRMCVDLTIATAFFPEPGARPSDGFYTWVTCNRIRKCMCLYTFPISACYESYGRLVQNTGGGDVSVLRGTTRWGTEPARDTKHVRFPGCRSSGSLCITPRPRRHLRVMLWEGESSQLLPSTWCLRVCEGQSHRPWRMCCGCERAVMVAANI